MEHSSGITTRGARPVDRAHAEALLRAAGLPLEGLDESFSDAIVAVEDGRVVGCVALEIHPGAALLRSLVVSPEHRGRLLGERLTREALALAKRRGVSDVYLLTETAAGFFPRFGFTVEDRSLAPAALRDSVEFRSACPSTAVMLRLEMAR